MTTLLYFKDKINKQKKLLNTVFFNKSLVRSSLGSQSLALLDNYSNFSVLNNVDTSNPPYDIGSLINSRSKMFVNSLNKEIKFRTSSCLFSPETQTSLNDLQFILTTSTQPQFSFNRLLLLKVLKGGFRCYYFGLVGFLPRKHANKLFLNFIDLLLTVIQTPSKTKKKVIGGVIGLFQKTAVNPYCFQGSDIFIS